MEDLIEVMQDPTSVGEPDLTTSVETSREVAVSRVLRGGALVIGGALLSVATAAFYGVTSSSGLPFALGMGAMAMGGIGFVELGRVAAHLRKYGSKASLIGFLATAGLGLSTVTAASSNWIGVTLGGGVWDWIVHWSMNAVYSLGVVVLVLVLRALVLWALEIAGPSHEEAPDG